MIKLDLTSKPVQLTGDLQHRLTQEYKKTGRSVWSINWLKEAVANLAFGKCCFTEIYLGEESKYMEIEHFLPKNLYPDFVMRWGNLYPSCKKSNTTKGNHDTLNLPIVNPFKDDPKEHFYIKNYRYYPKKNSQIAERTIAVVALNNREHFVNVRFRIGNEIIDIIENLKANIEDILNPKRRIRYISQIKGLMEQGNRRKEYSALVATVILSDKNYQEIESELRKNSLWDNELQKLKEELEFCALLET